MTIEYEVNIRIELEDEEIARLLFISVYPDMKIENHDLMSDIKLEKNTVILTIKSTSLSRLRGVFNSFIRVYKMIKDII